MCGLAGFVNVRADKRVALAYHLGIGIDSRGGHAAGYVSASPGKGTHVHYGRTLGLWGDTSRAFVTAACAGDLTILHARYATMGRKDVASNAHPFAIRRGGHTVLWGAHNGMLQGTHTSARKHDREHTVDSRELFELLADGHLDELRALQGYGVLTWIARDDRDLVRLVRLSDDAELTVARTECGAVVWASTWHILAPALQAAGMTAAVTYTIDTGKVYEAHANGEFTYSLHPDLTVAPRAPREPREYALPSWYGESRAGDVAAFDYADAGDDDPGDCPICRSYDTWAWGGTAECADCGAQWAFSASPALAEDCDAWDDQAWERYLASDRKAGQGSKSCT